MFREYTVARQYGIWVKIGNDENFQHLLGAESAVHVRFIPGRYCPIASRVPIHSIHAPRTRTLFRRRPRMWRTIPILPRIVLGLKARIPHLSRLFVVHALL